MNPDPNSDNAPPVPDVRRPITIEWAPRNGIAVKNADGTYPTIDAIFDALNPPPPVAAGRAGVELVERLRPICHAFVQRAHLQSNPVLEKLNLADAQTCLDAITALSAPGVEELISPGPVSRKLRDCVHASPSVPGSDGAGSQICPNERAEKAEAELAALRVARTPAPGAGETPRTNAEFDRIERSTGTTNQDRFWDMADFARQLERELAAARELSCRWEKSAVERLKQIGDMEAYAELTQHTPAARAATDGADTRRLLLFAGEILAQFHNQGEHGDVGGDFIQETGARCGLLEEKTMTEPCCDTCVCAELTDFPAQCFRLTELGNRAQDTAQRPAAATAPLPGEGGGVES